MGGYPKPDENKQPFIFDQVFFFLSSRVYTYLVRVVISLVFNGFAFVADSAITRPEAPS